MVDIVVVDFKPEAILDLLDGYIKRINSFLQLLNQMLSRESFIELVKSIFKILNFLGLSPLMEALSDLMNLVTRPEVPDLEFNIFVLLFDFLDIFIRDFNSDHDLSLSVDLSGAIENRFVERVDVHDCVVSLFTVYCLQLGHHVVVRSLKNLLRLVRAVESFFGVMAHFFYQFEVYDNGSKRFLVFLSLKRKSSDTVGHLIGFSLEQFLALRILVDDELWQSFNMVFGSCNCSPKE